MKFVIVSSKTPSTMRSSTYPSQSCCRGVLRLFLFFFVVDLKCDLSHLRLSTAAKFLATVTKEIVLFHISATSTLLRLSAHKNVKIEKSGLRMSQTAASFAACVKHLRRRQHGLAAGGKCISPNRSQSSRN